MRFAMVSLTASCSAIYSIEISELRLPNLPLACFVVTWPAILPTYTNWTCLSSISFIRSRHHALTYSDVGLYYSLVVMAALAVALNPRQPQIRRTRHTRMHAMNKGLRTMQYATVSEELIASAKANISMFCHEPDRWFCHSDLRS